MSENKRSLSSIMHSTDYFSISYVYLLIAVTYLFADRVPDWQVNMLVMLVYGSAFIILSWLSRRINHEPGAFALRVVIILALFSYLFKAMGPLQHIIHNGWFDEMLISWEEAVLGTETSIFLQHITTPLLTEWMMFAYVFYVPLLPLVAFACYNSSGRVAGEIYLLNIVTVYALCFTGFILLPVMTPMFYMPQAFTVSLDGGIFAWAGEWIRANQHYPGGALPSPHTAAGTIMLIFVYRYARKYLYFVIPVVLTIYIATVYGRYHYIWDSMTGILTAILTVRLTPFLTKFIAGYQTSPAEQIQNSSGFEISGESNL